MGATPEHRDLSRRLNDLTNDLALTLGRFDEVLDLLGVWADTYPDDGLARMSRHLITRCEGEAP